MKIAVIHSKYLSHPAKARPDSSDFCEEYALEYAYSNINKTLEQIGCAGQTNADIVCTHEDFTNIGGYCREYKFPDLFPSLVKKTTHDLRRLLSEAAKRHSMLIAANNYESEEGKIYNTSTLYGRNGEIIGRYRKVHLADSERWSASPGDEFPVFKSDIGNIGFVTCYDVIFPETCRILALNGADMIIHQTQGWGTGGRAFDDCAVGEAFMRVRAAENSVYLIVAKVIQGSGADGGRSLVIDNYGRITAESEICGESVLTAEIEPDFDMADKYDYNNFFSGVPSVRARMLLARRPELYTAISSEKPEISERYTGMRFKTEAGEPGEIMESWEALPDDEKNKFHW
jgi:predicted amidohydrolase